MILNIFIVQYMVKHSIISESYYITYHIISYDINCKGEMLRTPCQAQVKQLAQVQALFLGGTCVTIQLKAYCPWSQNVKGSWHQSNMAHAVA